MSVLLTLGLFNACNSDDDTDNPIVGTWELSILHLPGTECEIPSDQRDLYVFSPNGKVKVTKKTSVVFDEFPSEDGEYDYSYDKKKQIIQLCGKSRECIISGSEMRIDGYHSAISESVQVFIFIKK